MGNGLWSTKTYEQGTQAKIRSGSAFAYDAHTRRSGNYKAHEDLDPSKAIPSAGPLAGKVVRESRDSDEHPNSTPIFIGFDSTGSMGFVPRVVQDKLKTVFGLIMEKQYAPDPQVAVATYGDAWIDRVPLQVSQFESDNRVDDNLDKMFLEGGGGGNGGETASLMLYFAAHHTSTDSVEKRGKKGYLFFVADETMLDITPAHVERHIGAKPFETGEMPSLALEDIATAVQEKYEVVILLIDNLSARMQGSHEHYSRLFGADHVLTVEDPNMIAETIASLVGMFEGRDQTTVEDDLVASGVSKDVAVRVTTQVMANGVRAENTTLTATGAADRF